MKFTYKHTLYASYIGYITQAIVNNLTPLLFVTFQREFAISIEKIAVLISLNFGVQLLVDLLSIKFIDKMGYRVAAVLAHVLGGIGLISLGILPYWFSNPFWGIAIAVVINAIGGGLDEVLISPLVEALPSEESASAMSILHSFYCWGQVGVVLLSTLYFQFSDGLSWRFLPIFWSIIPWVNALFFAKVPLCRLVAEDERHTSLSSLFRSRIFWILLLLMVCAGASELSMSQWSSYFAELGLGVSKTVGDLLGPCAFAVLMGTARTLYGKYAPRLNVKYALLGSAVLCVGAYLLTVFSPQPLLALAGCAVCGFAVGVMWPGTISLSAEVFPKGGTAMFAVLALAGDAGCGGGPFLAGKIAELAEKVRGLPAMFYSSPLKFGLFVVMLFPLLMVPAVLKLGKKKREG